MVLIKDSTSVGNALKMRPNGRNEGPTTIVVEKYSKLSSYDDDKEFEEQVEDEKTIKIPVKNDNCIEKFGNDGRYTKRKRHLLREWWKNHILLQHGNKRL